MAITAVTPGSGGVVTTQNALISAKVTGWTPDKVVFILGSGRIERDGVYNASAQRWELTFDTATSPSGSGGQPAEPYWNYACALRVRAEGSRVEETQGHYFYVMTYDDSSPATTFAWRSALAWETPFSTFANGNGDEMEAWYKATARGGSGIGEYFATISTINGRKWATFRPDPAYLAANGELDQPTSGGIRAQFGTKAVIARGDYFCWAITIMIPVGNAVPEAQEQHANALQIYGPDFNGPNTGANDYNMGTPFALNMSARTKLDKENGSGGKSAGTRLASDKGLLYTTGNKTNPGLMKALLERYLVPGKPYTIAGEFWVSSDPRYGKGRLYLDEGSGLKPVQQPIPYPGTDDYTLFPFVLQSKYHRDQRIDIQVYGERQNEADELPSLWPNFAYQFGHHKIGPSIADVDPKLYPTTSGMPSGYIADRGQKLRLKRGDLVYTAT